MTTVYDGDFRAKITFEDGAEDDFVIEHVKSYLVNLPGELTITTLDNNQIIVAPGKWRMLKTEGY